MALTFCNFCPVPDAPSPAHHPYGHPRHVPLETWAEVAGGLRRAGWRVEYHPVRASPLHYVWWAPGGKVGYRSSGPDAPPPAVMTQARADGALLAPAHLAHAPAEALL